MKLGYSKLAMEAVPVATAIRHIADIGYDGIELDVDSCVKTGRISRLLKEHNLHLVSIGAYTVIGDDAYSRNICQLKKGIDFAAELSQDDEPPLLSVGPCWNIWYRDQLQSPNGTGSMGIKETLFRGVYQ